MIIEFFNLREIEKEKSQLKNEKESECLLKINRNIKDFFLFDEELFVEEQQLSKSKSEPNIKGDKNNNKIIKIWKKYDNSKIHQKNKESLITIAKNKKIKKNKLENNIFFNKIDDDTGNRKQNKIIFYNKEKVETTMDKEDINANKYKINNSTINEKNNINKDKNDIDLTKSDNDNKIINHINILGDNFSHNSSRKEKENSLNDGGNNRISFYSFSSLGRNFVLKNKICKSTYNNEIKFYKNNCNSNSRDNPIMTYYLGKNVPNFYLVTDKKSQEESDGFQNMNFFPLKEKETKNKNIMSCIYIDNKEKKINDEINEDNKNNDEDKDIKLNLNMHNEYEHEEKYENKNLNLDHNFIKDNNIMNKFGKNIINKKIINDDNNCYKIINDNINSNINRNIKIDNINNKKENNNVFLGNDNNFINKFNNLSLNNNNQTINENNAEFLKYKKLEENSIIINNNSFKNLNFKEINNIKIPTSLSNISFNLNYTDLKEFKLNQDIINELSNLNKNLDLNSNILRPFNYYNQSMDDFYNQINKQIKNDENNKELNFDNININNLNLTKNLNINSNINYINQNNNNENLNSINMLPYNKSFYEYTDDELLKFSIPLIKDQSGCRFLQEKIKENQYFTNNILFPRIKNNIRELASDPFGNYFLQILIEVISYDNLNILLGLMKNDFTSICICPHGTRVIQKFIEIISSKPYLVKIFVTCFNTKDLGVICKSAYGNHVIQKFLIIVHNPAYTKFIYDFIFSNFLEIAKTKHGVCVIQKCVYEGDELQRKKIFDLIVQNFDIIIKDQFANYLIEYILINTKTKEKFLEIMPLIKKLEENLVEYCKSKYSANVIEKLFEFNDNNIKEYILEYLLNNIKEKIIEILLDECGVYIIQKAIKLNTTHKNKIFEIINQNINELKKIDLYEFKYRGVLKIINSNKELEKLLYKTQTNNGDICNYNNKYKAHYNNDIEYKNNNRNKKRGRKYNRGKFNKY